MDAMEDTISIGLQVVEYFPDLLYKELAKKKQQKESPRNAASTHQGNGSQSFFRQKTDMNLARYAYTGTR